MIITVADVAFVVGVLIVIMFVVDDLTRNV